MTAQRKSNVISLDAARKEQESQPSPEHSALQAKKISEDIDELIKKFERMKITFSMDVDRE